MRSKRQASTEVAAYGMKGYTKSHILKVLTSFPSLAVMLLTLTVDPGHVSRSTTTVQEPEANRGMHTQSV